MREHVHRCLDEALSIAQSHLAPWNPFIEFCGLLNEAQQGFALRGAKGEYGELVFREAGHLDAALEGAPGGDLRIVVSRAA